MNKKLLAVFAVCVLSLPAGAQGPLQLPARWQDAIEQNVAYSTFQQTMETLRKSLLLTIPVTKQYFPQDNPAATIPFQETAEYHSLKNIQTYPSTAGCKAYVLDENWVMAGGTCLWNGRHTVDFTPSSATAIFATGLVEPNRAKYHLHINGKAIPLKENLFIQPHEHQAPHIILVRVPANTTLSHQLKNWPKINILAFENATPDSLTGGEFYIQSARFGTNAIHKRTLEKTSASLVTLKDHIGQISGVSTDPLVYVKQGQLRWVGVNNGITVLRYGNLAGNWDGKPSNDYFYFTKEDVEFIQHTLVMHDPAAWQRIEQRKGLEIL